MQALRDQGFTVEPFVPEGLDEALRLWHALFIDGVAIVLRQAYKGREDEMHSIVREILRLSEQDPPLTAESLLDVLFRRDIVRAKFLEQMERYPILVCPVSAIPAFRHGERSWTIGNKTVQYPDAFSYSQYFNLLGNPAAVVPMGRSAEGLPIGVQIVGRPWEEERVLAISQLCRTGRRVEGAAKRVRHMKVRSFRFRNPQRGCMSRSFLRMRNLAATLTMLIALGLAAHAFQKPPEVRYPPTDAGVDTLAARADAQQQTTSQFEVFHGFRFDDRLAASGVSFVHRIVDDSGLTYKAVHYDHGNGLAVADVDGDGLSDIYFVNQAGPSELWKNLGSGRFQNITSEAGVAAPGRIAVAASFADVDNDGDQDLFVTTVRGGNLLFDNDGRGRFRDVTKGANVGLSSHSSGSVFFDYNKDGLLDLLVCNVGRYTSEAKGSHGEYVGLPDAFSGHMYPERSERPVLYQNLGKQRFRDVTAAANLRPEGWCGDAAVADLNQDGWPDIYFLNMMGANHYFENQRGRTFVEKTKIVFPEDLLGRDGHQVLRLRQRQPPGPVRHGHAFGHGRERRTRARNQKGHATR